MAVEIPAVASPAGVNSEIVQHGWNEFLTTTTDEWLSSLRMLASDPSLRERIGAAVRRTVAERRSVQAVLPDFVNFLQIALGK